MIMCVPDGLTHHQNRIKPMLMRKAQLTLAGRLSLVAKRNFANFAALLLLSLAVLWHAPLLAHEFWMVPAPAQQSAGSKLLFSLMVGEQFQGDVVGVSRQQTAGLRHYSTAGVIDLLPQLHTRPAGDFAVVLNAPGTHLIAFESPPNTLTLPPDSFNAYLHDEGLDFIKDQRKAAGTAGQPGRERYTRYVKTLVSAPFDAGTHAGSTIYATPAGQRLELLPLTNPLLLVPLDALRVRVEFEGKPLAGALVKAWHRHSGQTVMIRATTTAEGIATVTLPFEGAWMVSVVHMVAAQGVKNIDWDSSWGNLSFVLPAGK